jgi:integrase
MTYTVGHVPAHKGKVTTAQPIKDLTVISKIKEVLTSCPRDLALFTLGINTAFRASDLLELHREDLQDLADGCMEIFTRERKTGKLRRVVVNAQTAAILRRHLETSSGEYLFEGQRGRLSVGYFGRLVKQWCSKAGIDGQFATHTLRKTFSRVNYEHFGVKLATLMFALNHDSERTTLRYLGIVDEDVAAVYQNAI